jgi:hypothetical protein
MSELQRSLRSGAEAAPDVSHEAGTARFVGDSIPYEPRTTEVGKASVILQKYRGALDSNALPRKLGADWGFEEERIDATSKSVFVDSSLSDAQVQHAQDAERDLAVRRTMERMTIRLAEFEQQERRAKEREDKDSQQRHQQVEETLRSFRKRCGRCSATTWCKCSAETA